MPNREPAFSNFSHGIQYIILLPASRLILFWAIVGPLSPNALFLWLFGFGSSFRTETSNDRPCSCSAVSMQNKGAMNARRAYQGQIMNTFQPSHSSVCVQSWMDSGSLAAMTIAPGSSGWSYSYNWLTPQLTACVTAYQLPWIHEYQVQLHGTKSWAKQVQIFLFLFLRYQK